MSNIFKSALLLVGAALMFTSCSDDRDSNPVLQTPESFVLNTPAYANQPIDLTHSKTINLTWSQPDYGGFPVAVNYTIELSTTNEWTISNEKESADESGQTQCNYYVLLDTYNACHAEIEAAKVAKAVQMMEDFIDEDNVPDVVELYARVKAITKGSGSITSNVVKFKVAPKFVDLSAANPVLWYLVGNCIGNGTWNNGSTSDIGNSLIPLLPVPGATFDENGDGTLIHVGYFPEGGQFKFIKTPGSWDNQMNYQNVDIENSTSVSDQDGDNHNIGISTAGYYKITMNTIKKNVIIEKYTGTPTIFNVITMPGEYQGWNTAGNSMTRMNGTEPHDWYIDATFDSFTGLKFANGSWDVSWGSTDFPFGQGFNSNDPNIPVLPGEYRVYFNDILGIYYFSVPE